MSRSVDPGHFFQSAAALNNAARKVEKSSNDYGEPVTLPSKILAVHANEYAAGDAAAVFVAEAAGMVKRIDLDVSCSTLVPLTCLALSTPRCSEEGDHLQCLYAGSWDKNVYSWTLTYSADGNLLQRTSHCRIFVGHTDFVKAVLFMKVGSANRLVSGSSDTTIIVWDADLGEQLFALQGHGRGVQALALDPWGVEEPSDMSATIYSGDSNREIRAWRISSSQAYEVDPKKPDVDYSGSTVKEPLLIHETSIYALRFDPSSGDLLTASADKTAKLLSRVQDFDPDSIFQHPDFVRDVCATPSSGYIITGCRDENVRVWDRGSGNLVHIYDGHFEEVTGLALLGDGAAVVSVSIDGTVRSWDLTLKGLQKAKAEKEARGIESGNKKAENKNPMLTAEEEAELAELMEDDE